MCNCLCIHLKCDIFSGTFHQGNDDVMSLLRFASFVKAGKCDDLGSILIPTSMREEQLAMYSCHLCTPICLHALEGKYMDHSLL